MNEFTKATHALDGIPVTAIYSDGREKEMTVAKALSELEKQAAFDRALERLAKAEPIHRLNRMFEAYQIEQKYKRAEKRLVSLIKAELMRRQTDAMKKKRLKLERKTEMAKSLVNDTLSEVAKSQSAAEALLAEHTAFLADAEKRIDAMRARLEAGQVQIRISQESQAIADLAREDQIRADWAYKASLTNDPTLRAVYMARAEGKETTDDEV